MNEPWCAEAFYRKSWCFSPMQKIKRHAVADIPCRDVLFSNCVMAPVYAFLQMRPEGDDLHAIVSQSVWSTSAPGKLRGFCNYDAAVCLPLQQHTFLSSSWKCWTDKGTFFYPRLARLGKATEEGHSGEGEIRESGHFHIEPIPLNYWTILL